MLRKIKDEIQGEIDFNKNQKTIDFCGTFGQLDEVCNVATYAKIDMLTNKKEDIRMLLIEGYSLKSKVEDTIAH
nr:hypothetical protein [Tanacetum cinerariifolium]